MRPPHLRYLLTITSRLRRRFLIYALLTPADTSLQARDVALKYGSNALPSCMPPSPRALRITSCSTRIISPLYTSEYSRDELGKTRSYRLKTTVRFTAITATRDAIRPAGYPARSSIKPFNMASVSASSICLSVRQRSMRGNRTATPDLWRGLA